MVVAALLERLLLKNAGVKVRDGKAVAAKIESMIQAGYDKLMTISDFDFTLTAYTKNGKRCVSTHSMFEDQVRETSEEFHEQMVHLKDKYIAIEYDPKMPIEQKVPYMEEWWRTAHDLIVEYKFEKHLLEEMVAKSKVTLREEAKKLLTSLQEHAIPLVLFSAGIGNIIEFVLEQQVGFMPRNVHIISNFMLFDSNGICVAFSEPLIHTFNKNSTVVKQEAEFFHKLADRTHVILLGDSLGDVHMDVGVEKESVVLKIGFLNFNVEELLEHYMQEYDIVLVGDETMSVPCEIFRWIETNGKNGIV